MKYRTAIAVAATVFTASGAQAEITEKTRCSEFVATSDSFERTTNTVDREKLREFYLYMGNAMDGLDIDHIQAGKPGIMASLSDDGRQNLVAGAAVQCRNHTNMTVWNAAAVVYRGIRDLEMQFGAAK